MQILTVGQYLRPTENHLPVVRYWHPDEFDALRDAAYELGFESVASGPLVRSSYHADESAREVAERARPSRSEARSVPMLEPLARLLDGGQLARRHPPQTEMASAIL